MPDVHLLGEVRGTVIDHDPPWDALGCWLRLIDTRYESRQKGGGEGDVDKPRARNFKRVVFLGRQVRDDLFCQRPGIGFHPFCGTHHPIGLIVAKFWSLGLPNHWVRLVNAGSQHCLVKRFAESLSNIHGAPEMRVGAL